MPLTFNIHEWHKSKFFFVPLQVVRAGYSALLAAATAAAFSTTRLATTASTAVTCLLSPFAAALTTTALLAAATLSFVTLVSLCHFLSLLD